MPNTVHKHRGFEGELIIEIPNVAWEECHRLPVINSLFISKMGFYPKALHHYYHRQKGIASSILLYSREGKGWIRFKENTVRMEAGSVYMISGGIPHTYGADDKTPWTLYWIHLLGAQSNEMITAIMGEKARPGKPIQVNPSEKRDAIFRQIADTFQKGYSSSNLFFANMLLQYYLAGFIIPERFQEQPAAAQLATPTDKAIGFMQKNLSRKITLENIAQSAHLSVSFFSRKFKEETGYAPIEYFNHLRVQQACQLLHFSKLRINEVAFEIGIDDPLYFSRLFKQQMGLSPAAYRKNGSEIRE